MTQKVLIDSIKIGVRHRIDIGDIQELAKSIAGRGLLHLPVVTTDMELVCGFRRIQATKSLDWTEIDVRIIDPDDLVMAERDENEFRKEFTHSERVAIARTIEARIGNRQGSRTDLAKPELKPAEGGLEMLAAEAKSSNPPSTHQDNYPDVLPGVQTRDIAAKAAGFGSSKPYRDAAKVVDAGVPELVRAVDEGSVKVSAAAEVASLPKPEQVALVAEGPAAVKAAAKEIREEKQSPSMPVDASRPGITPTPDQAEVWSNRWAKFWENMNRFLVSLPRRGGIVQLTSGWTPKQRKNAAVQLKALADACNRCVAELERIPK